VTTRCNVTTGGASAPFEQAYPGLRINDIVGRMCADFAIGADLASPIPLTSFPRPELTSSVGVRHGHRRPGQALARIGDGSRWPARSALSASRLLRASPVTSPRGMGSIAPVAAPTPGDVVDVLTAARAVVGVDSGPTHLAVHQGTPTVTICRPGNIYLRPWPHTGRSSATPATPRAWRPRRDYAYNDRVDLRGFEWQPRRCPVDGRCLDAVHADAVLQALG
jgi:hypothetical protein